MRRTRPSASARCRVRPCCVEPLDRRQLLSTTYYVSPTGSNANAGTSTAAPLLTLAAVNGLKLLAGDQVLLAGGASFAGPLTLTATSAAGTATDPITIASYGTGTATINAGAGDGITVTDTAGVDIHGLTIVGDGPGANTGAGIQLTSNLPSDAKLDHVDVDSVDVSGFGFAGIAIGGTTDGNGGGSGFQDVSITHSAVHDDGAAGIFSYAGDYTANPAPYGLANVNVYVGHVTAYDNAGYAGQGDSGNGIELGNVDGGTIEYCTAYDNGANNDSTAGGPVGIWAYNSALVVIQHCSSYDNQATHDDGDGFDLDGGCTDCTVQDNYSDGNDGAGYLCAEFAGASAWSGNVLRYNISQDDGRANNYAGFDLWTANDSVPLIDSQVYGNTVYLTDPGNGTSPVGFHLEAATHGLGVYNNIFDVTAGLRPLSVTHGGTGVTFAGNDYWAGTDADTLDLNWLGKTYSTLAGLRDGTGQEVLSGSAVGLADEPGLADAGGAPTIAHADDLPADLTAYQLSPDSPLIDAGVSLTALNLDGGGTDFFGTAVPQGDGYDIGADELIPAASSPTPTPTSTPTTTTTPSPTPTPTPTPAPTPTATVTTLTASPATPTVAGAPVTLTATVSPAGTGTVTFAVGALTLGADTVTAGTATLTTTDLPTGVDAITATFAGSDVDAASTSSPVAVTVNPPALLPTITADTLPATTVAGVGHAHGALFVNVTNGSTKTETGTAHVELLVSPDGVDDASAIAVTTALRKVSLRPGKSTKLAVPLSSLPTALTVGTYDWLARVTDGAALAAVSAAGPSLTVVPATVSLSTQVSTDRLPANAVAPGRAGGWVTVAVSNRGTVATTGPLTATLYLSLDDQLSGAIALGKTTHRTTAQPAGRAVAFTVAPGKLPSTLTAGNYAVLLAVTDDRGHSVVTTLPTSLIITAG